MNKERREFIEDAVQALETSREKLEELLDALREEDSPSAVLTAETLSELRTFDIEEAKSAIESAHEEEEEYYDNMPENFQNGEKGDAAQEAINYLDSAKEEIDAIEFVPEDADNKTGDELAEHIEEIIGKLDSAIDYANASCA